MSVTMITIPSRFIEQILSAYGMGPKPPEPRDWYFAEIASTARYLEQQKQWLREILLKDELFILACKGLANQPPTGLTVTSEGEVQVEYRDPQDAPLPIEQRFISLPRAPVSEFLVDFVTTEDAPAKGKLPSVNELRERAEALGIDVSDLGAKKTLILARIEAFEAEIAAPPEEEPPAPEPVLEEESPEPEEEAESEPEEDSEPATEEAAPEPDEDIFNRILSASGSEEQEEARFEQIPRTGPPANAAPKKDFGFVQQLAKKLDIDKIVVSSEDKIEVEDTDLF